MPKLYMVEKEIVFKNNINKGEDGHTLATASDVMFHLCCGHTLDFDEVYEIMEGLMVFSFDIETCDFHYSIIKKIVAR